MRRNQDPAPSLHYCLTALPLFLHPLPSVISNCLNLPFETQGRSRRLKPFTYKQETGDMERLLYPGEPHDFNPPFLRYSSVLWETGIRIINSAEELGFRGTWLYFFASTSVPNACLLHNRPSRNVSEQVKDQWLF